VSLERRPEKEEIEKWIEALVDLEPPFTSLGAPFLVDTEATQALVEMGEIAVPALVDALGNENSKVVMYAAYCLGLIGDPSVVPQLRRIQENFASREPRSEYDFGVIGAAKQAEQRLTEGGS
jgi:HEAT repeat protein